MASEFFPLRDAGMDWLAGWCCERQAWRSGRGAHMWLCAGYLCVGLTTLESSMEGEHQLRNFLYQIDLQVSLWGHFLD